MNFCAILEPSEQQDRKSAIRQKRAEDRDGGVRCDEFGECRREPFKSSTKSRLSRAVVGVRNRGLVSAKSAVCLYIAGSVIRGKIAFCLLLPRLDWQHWSEDGFVTGWRLASSMSASRFPQLHFAIHASP